MKLFLVFAAMAAITIAAPPYESYQLPPLWGPVHGRRQPLFTLEPDPERYRPQTHHYAPHQKHPQQSAQPGPSLHSQQRYPALGVWQPQQAHRPKNPAQTPPQLHHAHYEEQGHNPPPPPANPAQQFKGSWHHGGHPPPQGYHPQPPLDPQAHLQQHHAPPPQHPQAQHPTQVDAPQAQNPPPSHEAVAEACKAAVEAIRNAIAKATRASSVTGRFAYWDPITDELERELKRVEGGLQEHNKLAKLERDFVNWPNKRLKDAEKSARNAVQTAQHTIDNADRVLRHMSTLEEDAAGQRF